MAEPTQMNALDSIQGEDRAARRLREATRYVSRSWLPVSQVSLKRVQDRLNSGSDVALSEIMSELKGDFGLFAHVLRTMGTLIGPEGSSANPVDLIAQLNVKQLKELFTINPLEVSSHELSNAKDIQLARVRHSVISCSTVEVMAARTTLNPQFAFLCALLRQLGHMMVSWNYPSSCVRAKVAMAQSGASYEEELRNVLGFAPHRLGIEAAAGWCTNPDLLLGVGLGVNSEVVESAAHISAFDGGEILRLCEIGETLARVSDPELYPGAAREWREHQESLTKVVGVKGLTVIRSRIDELFPQYVALAPNLIPADLSAERSEKKVNLLYSKKLIEENRYLHKCPPELQTLFGEMYERVVPQDASIDAVNTLIAKVIPAAGYLSGCVYLLDPARMVLVPRIKIGDAKNRLFKAVSCSCGGEKAHPVAEAFHCATPFKEEGVVLNGDVVSHVTGKFGNNEKVGVLFLEFKDTLPVVLDTGTRLLYFKAIRQALNDCLNLR